VPDENFNRTDAFTYTVSDGGADTAEVRVGVAPGGRKGGG